MSPRPAGPGARRPRAASDAAPAGTATAPADEADADRARRAEERAVARRFTARRRAVLRRRWTWAAAGAALVLFVAAGLLTPIMSVREIRVEGTTQLAPAVVEDALAGLRGRPLALVTDDEVGRMLAGITEVQSYSTRAEPPSRLVVEIVERQRIGALAVPGGYEVVDAAGVVLERPAAAPADAPVLELGGAPVGSAAFASAAAVMLALPTELRPEVASVAAATLDDVRLTLRDGDVVVWGSSDQSAEKARALALLRAAGGDAVRTYDVTSPDAPATRTS